MWHVIVALEIVLIGASCAYAVVFGSACDRLGAIFILLSYAIASLLMAWNAPRFPTVEIFGCDFALAVGLLVIAIRYGSIWLGCAMLLESIDLFSQALAFAGLGLSNFSQMTLNNLVSILMCACVAAGALSAQRKRHAADGVFSPVG